MRKEFDHINGTTQIASSLFSFGGNHQILTRYQFETSAVSPAMQKVMWQKSNKQMR